jgi:transcriptional regulator with PAS, ATPase and Fis domain
MAYGRISVVLGVQAGLGAIIQFGETVKSGGGLSSYKSGSAGWCLNRLSDQEILAILKQLSQLSALFKKEGLIVKWSVMGASPQLELPLLTQVLGFSIDPADIETFEEITSEPCDAVFYVPLDVQQPRQVEQLARLSMILPRTRHVAFAASPKWNHAQLMALRETWEWLDPKAAPKIVKFAEEIISANGGITRKDIAKLPLTEIPKMEESADPIIITKSTLMKEVLALADAVADTDSTVLIGGDSGTGKELIAQRIHAHCHRSKGPIVAVNCGAIPSELLESELFGHMKGAFTGAVNTREGRFQAAEGGTLFLDEIGELGPNLQVKLLRVLQTRKYEPVGSTKSRFSDVRIIAATNKNLEEEVKMNRFREDLFYRLNVIPIYVPALKERKEDIPLLIEYFVKKFNREKSRRVTGVTRLALRYLVAYEWPGNVRELENLMERMVIIKSSGMIDHLDFPEKYRRLGLSEIEFEDLMNPQPMKNLAQGSSGGGVFVPTPSSGTGTIVQATVPYNVSSTAAPVQKTVFEQNTGEGINMMKITGYNYAKPVSAEPVATPVQSSQSSEPGAGHSQTTQEIVNQATQIATSSQAEGSSVDLGVISVDQALRLLADRMAFPNEGLDFNSVVDQFENILILQALEKTGWNRNRAAQLLRLNRTTLVEKLKKKQLLPPLRYGDQIFEGNA